MKKFTTKNGRLANIMYILARYNNGMTQKNFTLICKDVKSGKKFWFEISENKAIYLHLNTNIWLCEYYHKLNGELVIEWFKKDYFRFLQNADIIIHNEN